jgi:hypothetical protein
MDEKEPIILKSENKSDAISKTRTIYDATPGEVIWKNFLAGFSRGFGGVLVYLILMFVIGEMFFYLVLPKLTSAVTSYTNLINPGGSTTTTKSVQQLFGQ